MLALAFLLGVASVAAAIWGIGAGASPNSARGGARGTVLAQGALTPATTPNRGNRGSNVATPRNTPSPTASPSVTLPPGLTAEDVRAGLLSKSFPQHGSGHLNVVPGRVPAPGTGSVRQVVVQIEDGLQVDPQKFATFVMATLNDPRSWGAGHRMTFARTDDVHAPIHVVLATPDTSSSMCLPLITDGVLSCRHGDSAILTVYRWVNATPDYGTDRTEYREYLVNHEVGHVLGHGHVLCPGTGKPAPVMLQQTKGLHGCAINPWPYPDSPEHLVTGPAVS